MAYSDVTERASTASTDGRLWVQDATSQDIRALFAQFGTIKPQNGAITVKHNGNNNSFAYVDFVDVASAQACVDAKDVQLNGTTVSFCPIVWHRIAHTCFQLMTLVHVFRLVLQA